MLGETSVLEITSSTSSCKASTFERRALIVVRSSVNILDGGFGPTDSADMPRWLTADGRKAMIAGGDEFWWWVSTKNLRKAMFLHN